MFRSPLTILPKINSNDFSRFGIIYQIRIRILASWKLFQKTQFDFFVCSGFDHIQCDCTCACAVACLHTCVDQMQTHSRQTHTQTTYTAQTRHTSIPTVVVSLMIDDNMYENLYMYMIICVYMCMYMCIMYMCMSVCMCMCVFMCCFSSFQDPTDGELSLTSGETLVE